MTSFYYILESTIASKVPNVVYFDQRMHACACVHMVKNNEKRLNIIKKVLFSSYARETHVRLTQEHTTNYVKLTFEGLLLALMVLVKC